MAKGIIGAAFVCAVLIVVGFLPVAAGGDHVVTKENNGPWASAETWTFRAPEYGQYSWRIANFGLKWMVMLFYDNSTGVPIEIAREHIRFAASGAYPTGVVYTIPVIMAKDRAYEITAVPNGPRSAYAVVTDPPFPDEPPVASFTSAVVGYTVHVNASTSYDVDGVIERYLWDWGDGTTGEGVTASHTYVRGLYVLSLTVVDDVGLTDTMSATIFFDGPGLPMAVFTWTYTPDWYSVLVNGSQSYDPDGFIVSYAWDFGDGSTATGVTATHSYAGGGSFTISLQVTDNDGLTNTVTHPVQISPVIMTFTYMVIGFTVTVDAGAVGDPDGTIVSYAWDWGDGGTGSGVTATHTYAGEGTYLITLTVTYNNGFTYTISKEVAI